MLAKSGTSSQNFESLPLKLHDINILVIGDIMLDKYVFGKINRLSPEAPVPVVDVTEVQYRLGGCGNVIRNIVNLGVSVTCVAAIGDDRAGKLISTALKKANVSGALLKALPMTTVKERIMTDDHRFQLMRIDRERKTRVNANNIINILKTLNPDDFDYVVVSDYAKGMMSATVMDYLREVFDPNVILVDPKPQNIGYYNGVFLITPNKKEWDEIQNNQGAIDRVKNVLVTQGKDGMTLLHPGKKSKFFIPPRKVDVYNVSGAGDTVIATVAVGLSLGLDLPSAGKVAARCAEYVITKPLTETVPMNKFMKILKTQT